MLEVRLLKKGYKNNKQFYEDFISDKINSKEEYFTDEVILIESALDFPIYMNISDDKVREEEFLKAFDIMSKYYINTNRDTHFEEIFWHSLFCTIKREYLLEKYPKILDGMNHFNNIVIKKFDWENYVYKCILAAQYIGDNCKDEDDKYRYYKLIIDNLDIYNYIIKYEIFRNDKFMINILDIIEETGLSKVLKAKIKGRSDLGKDERFGRRVIFEFNKSYPIVMAPMLEKDELKEKFLEYLGLYYDIENQNI